MPTADEIIETLGMQSHPEGGYFVETFRDPEGVDGRGHSTVIYFLLKAGESSHWHRVDATECWLWHGGAPLSLKIADHEGVPIVDHTMGTDVLAGHEPQVIVPKGAWQSAASLGDWTLVSCIVAPAFQFEGFELAPTDWSPQK
ncbi:cupin domain-containing protein [uncultured Cohaesibacter sp.]|uniref:cupin domain-containing protein n=1 Tax=uncultured Cohaesibacter sp. TaxID=1002546 RepID=UPI0029C7CC2D|nr:cupin domain-containing protein [uncultured Cohaesibacter sp.]